MTRPKVELMQFEFIGEHRLFYVANNELIDAVTANCYTAGNGKEIVSFKNLEFEIWDLNFKFEIPGKYCFVVFENSNKTVVLIVTIVHER